MAALGSIRTRIPRFQVRRNDQTLTTSWTIRMGRVIEAASTGDTDSAIKGTAITPTPAKPPLARPRIITAGIASA